jgi:hypothetical protein
MSQQANAYGGWLILGEGGGPDNPLSLPILPKPKTR